MFNLGQVSNLLLLFLLLLQRLGIILVLAFLLVNNHFFRQIIQERSRRSQVILILIFGVFVVIANLTGVEITNTQALVEKPILTGISHTDSLANTRTLVITSASLVGGPMVGAVVGLIGGIHRYIQGGFSSSFYIVSSAIVGWIIGKAGDYLKGSQLYPSEMQVASLGVCAELIQMVFIGIFSGWDLVKLIFIPMTLLNSVGATIFLMILKTYLSNEQQLRAVQTRDVLELTNETLPYLRQGLNQVSARHVCEIIKSHTNFDAVGLTDRVNVLAHVGAGQNHHIAGQPVKTDLSKNAIAKGMIQIAYSKQEIRCPDDACPLCSAIVIPLKINSKTIGALKMYFVDTEKLTVVEKNLAEGLAQIFSGQLAIGIAEEKTKLANDAEIKALQAQINPHFFFNAINTISALMRFDVEKARTALFQLSTFFRTSLQGGQEKEISLKQEKSHVDAYIGLEQLRFPDKYQLKYDVHVSENVLLPPFFLQILVENAVRHAFKERKKANCINVTIKPKTDTFIVQVSDNGIGIKPEILPRLGESMIKETTGTGTALVNLNNRLTVLYGSRSRLHFESSSSGTKVWAELPIRGENV